MATSGATGSNLLDLVHCDLCLEKYNASDRQPKLLHCSHTFCLACVEKYHESKRKMRLPCPNCRELFTVPRDGVTKLNTNIMVVNLLDHLDPFIAEDTDDGFPEASAALKEKTKQELKPILCNVHPEEKCDFYCDDCGDPLCADCMVALNKGPHKSHSIRKLGDVLDTFNTQRKHTAELVMNMTIEGKKRTEELLEELVLSRDSLMKDATSKYHEAHEHTNKWFQNITAAITQVYDKLQGQIIQFALKEDLQELQLSLEKIKLQQIDGNLKEAQSTLHELQTSLTSWKESAVCSTQCWSFDMGKISDCFTIDLGHITEPKLKLPDVHSFPYTIEKASGNNELDKHTSRKQQPKKPGFRLLSDLQMNPPSHSSVGLTNDKAVVCFKEQSTIKMITLRNNEIVDLYQKSLPGKLDYSCKKYILNNSQVLLRDTLTGPSYLLNSQLELVSTFQEDYGIIIGADSTHWVAFYSDDDYCIRIYHLEQNHLLQTLKRPAGVWWQGMTSICRHPDYRFTAVVDAGGGSLCIYNHDGHHLRTLNLQFKSQIPPVISCSRRHLYVLSHDPVAVAVITWSGQLVTMLDKQQHGIPEGEKIHNIVYGENHITIAIGNGDSVKSFKTFQCV